LGRVRPGTARPAPLPFYRRGLDNGTLTRDQAEELLQCFWIKFNNQPRRRKWRDGSESGTYTDFAQINIGGLREDGSDGVNEVTYLLLDVVENMRLLQPSASLQVSKKNPIASSSAPARSSAPASAAVDLQRRPDRARTGAAGKSVTDARNGGSSGASRWRVRQGELQPDGLLQHAEGVGDRAAQRRRSAHRQAARPQTGDPAAFRTFDELFAAYEAQLQHFIDIKVRGNNIIERLYAQYLPRHSCHC